MGDRRISDKDNPIVPKKAGIENRLYNALLIGLNTERSQLYDRINQRVERMFEKGIVKEAENLFRQQGNFQSKKQLDIVNLLDTSLISMTCRRLKL